MLARYQGRLSPQAAGALREAFGLNTDKSWLAQYFDYWRRMFTGDFGLSLGFFPAPVSEILGQAIPWTLGLVGITTLIAFVLGTLLGVYSGWWRNTPHRRQYGAHLAISQRCALFLVCAYHLVRFFVFARLVSAERGLRHHRHAC